MGMQLQTLGHASLCLKDHSGDPLIMTDPWLVGSSYWRSWWLQNYPSESEIDYLKQSKFVYLTHEHPDHLHIPSIRLLGENPEYLCPKLPNTIFYEFLTEEKFRTRQMTGYRWIQISPEVSILSIPLWNSDSILLIDTPTALIVNINDAKPKGKVRDKIREYVLGTPKKVIVLSSYSPAGIVNSFTRQNQRLSMRSKQDYVSYICKLCDELKADYFIPFASQVVYRRSDSEWANDFKVTYDNLSTNWTSATALLHPHTKIDLDSFQTSFVAENDYNAMTSARQIKTIEQEEAKDRVDLLDKSDIKAFRKKFSLIRWALIPFFWQGIAFDFGDERFIYYPLSGKISRSYKSFAVEISVPRAPFRDALLRNQLGDLGISMFMLVELGKNVRPIYVYGMFMLITFDDCRHLKSFNQFWDWMTDTFNGVKVEIPQAPAAAQKMASDFVLN